LVRWQDDARKERGVKIETPKGTGRSFSLRGGIYLREATGDFGEPGDKMAVYTHQTVVLEGHNFHKGRGLRAQKQKKIAGGEARWGRVPILRRKNGRKI